MVVYIRFPRGGEEQPCFTVPEWSPFLSGDTKSKGGLQIVPDVDLSDPLHAWQTFMRECISFKQNGLALGNDSK